MPNHEDPQNKNQKSNQIEPGDKARDETGKTVIKVSLTPRVRDRSRENSRENSKTALKDGMESPLDIFDASPVATPLQLDSGIPSAVVSGEEGWNCLLLSIH